jgi:hypothetical protein
MLPVEGQLNVLRHTQLYGARKTASVSKTRVDTMPIASMHTHTHTHTHTPPPQPQKTLLFRSSESTLLKLHHLTLEGDGLVQILADAEPGGAIKELWGNPQVQWLRQTN